MSSNKRETAYAVGILLGVIKWEPLLSLSEEYLNEIYRNYIKNALAYNHLEDEVKELRTKVMLQEAN